MNEFELIYIYINININIYIYTYFSSILTHRIYVCTVQLN